MRKFDKASEYVGYELLYKAKAEYYEKLCAQLVDELVTAQTVIYNYDSDEYYWEATGETLGDDIE